MKTLLILGGSGLARRWAESLASLVERHCFSLRLVYALAGVTETPRLPSADIETRHGGFGGWQGLRRWLEDSNAVAVVDGTHPFADGISANARLATRALSIPLFCLTQNPFPRAFAERRYEVRSQSDLQRVLLRLPAQQRRCVVLALGAQRVVALARRAPVQSLLVRSFASHSTISSLRFRQLRLRRARAVDFCSMGRFSAQSVRNEARWLRAKRVSLLVCRDSGAREAYAKVLAARLLSIPTLMFTRGRASQTRSAYSGAGFWKDDRIYLGRSFAPIIEFLRCARLQVARE